MQDMQETKNCSVNATLAGGEFTLELMPTVQARDLSLRSSTPTQAEHGRIMLEHMPMVRLIAIRISKRVPPTVELEDLVSAGLLGLLEAVNKFDPGKKIPFAGFAHFRVRGAILDSLRNGDWAPRTLRHKGRAVRDASRTLFVRLRRVPSEEEIAAELKISLPSYQKLRGDLDGLEVGSLCRDHNDESAEDEDIAIAGDPEDNPLRLCLREEIRHRLSAAVDSLPERERQVLKFLYYEELSQAEVGLILGLSASRINQIRKLAFGHLRVALAAFTPAVQQSSDAGNTEGAETLHRALASKTKPGSPKSEGQLRCRRQNSKGSTHHCREYVHHQA